MGRWYEIIIDKGKEGTEGIISFKTILEAERVIHAFARFIKEPLYVALEEE